MNDLMPFLHVAGLYLPWVVLYWGIKGMGVLYDRRRVWAYHRVRSRLPVVLQRRWTWEEDGQTVLALIRENQTR